MSLRFLRACGEWTQSEPCASQVLIRRRAAIPLGKALDGVGGTLAPAELPSLPPNRGRRGEEGLMVTVRSGHRHSAV